MTSKTKRVLTGISKYKIYKLHETHLKEEFPCIYRKFLLRQVRQNTFSRSVENNNVKSKGGEGLCRTHSIAFLVSGCREPIGNNRGDICLRCTKITLAHESFCFFLFFVVRRAKRLKFSIVIHWFLRVKENFWLDVFD